MDNEKVPPLEYLLACSKTSLHSFWLLQMNREANLRKELLALEKEWIEATALALLAEWFRVHGEALMAAIISPPDPNHQREAACFPASSDCT